MMIGKSEQLYLSAAPVNGHLSESPAPTATLSMTSSTTSLNLHCGLLLFFLPGSSIFKILYPIYAVFLLFTRPNQLSLSCLTDVPISSVYTVLYYQLLY